MSRGGVALTNIKKIGEGNANVPFLFAKIQNTAPIIDAVFCMGMNMVE